jgi:hypothetical protein
VRGKRRTLGAALARHHCAGTTAVVTAIIVCGTGATIAAIAIAIAIANAVSGHKHVKRSACGGQNQYDHTELRWIWLGKGLQEACHTQKGKWASRWWLEAPAATWE